MRLTWLPAVLRAAGLTVHEQPGWQTRGYEPYDPYGLIVHATAGNLTPESDIRVLLTGSATAPPPISQLFLARTGEWWVIASGRCNHALTGWAGLLKGYGNTRLIGIEAANDNRGEPWRPQQYDSYVAGVAAICRHLGWDPSERVSGHKEHQPGGYPGKTSTKTDPTFDMGAFRARVRDRINTPEEDLDMTTLDNIDKANWNGGTSMGPAVPEEYQVLTLGEAAPNEAGHFGNAQNDRLYYTQRLVERLLVKVEALEARPAAALSVEDRAAIVRELAGLVPSADRVADVIAGRLAD